MLFVVNFISCIVACGTVDWWKMTMQSSKSISPLAC